MNDPGGVGSCQGVGDADSDFQGLSEGQPFARHDLLECLALHQLHHQHVLAVDGEHIVDGHDPGVVECRGGLRLVEEAQPPFGIHGLAGWKDLEGDKSLENGVPGLVDDPHAALAELLDDAIPVDGLADHLIHPPAFVGISIACTTVLLLRSARQFVAVVAIASVSVKSGQTGFM